MIENGLTHAFDPAEDGNFFLECIKEADRIRYILINDGSLVKELKDLSNKIIEEGYGLKYVRTRLQENYPDKWKLTYGPDNGFWRIEFSIQY